MSTGQTSSITPWTIDAEMAAKEKARLLAYAAYARNKAISNPSEKQIWELIAAKYENAAANQPPTTAAEAEAADLARQRQRLRQRHTHSSN